MKSLQRSIRGRSVDLGFEADAPLVLFAGRLAEQKRVDDLLKALDLLQHVQPDIRTVIAGDGPFRGRLEETAHAYHLDGRVRFLGHRNDIPRVLAAADLVVLPSAYEGCQRGAGSDVTRQTGCSDCAPGTTEVVIDGQTGLLVPIGNAPLLARAIRDIVRDPACQPTRRGGGARRSPISRSMRWLPSSPAIRENRRDQRGSRVLSIRQRH